MAALSSNLDEYKTPENSRFRSLSVTTSEDSLSPTIELSEGPSRSSPLSPMLEGLSYSDKIQGLGNLLTDAGWDSHSLAGIGRSSKVYLLGNSESKKCTVLKIFKDRIGRTALTKGRYGEACTLGLNLPCTLTAQTLFTLSEDTLLVRRKFEEVTDNEMHVAALFHYLPEAISLSDRIEKKPFSKEAFIDAALHVVDRIRNIHANRIIHRDIKPENFLIGDKGQYPVHLCDFGLSVKLPEGSNEIQLGVAGSPAYKSIEAKKGSYSFATDLWSLGVLLYKMWAGDLPNSLKHMDLGSHSVSGADITFPEGTPEVLKHLIQNLMHPTPSKRPSLEESRAILVSLRRD